MKGKYKPYTELSLAEIEELDQKILNKTITAEEIEWYYNTGGGEV